MIKIVTDSTADLLEELYAQYGIEVVPLYINFGDKVYKENVELTKQEFYTKLKEYEPIGIPTTSQPTPQDFIDVYNKFMDEQIISIHISSKLSGTCQSANLARNSVGGDITIIDSELASAGLGLLVLYAAKAAKNGLNKEEIIALINRLKQEIRVYFTVESLKFLEKNGRIGKAQALIGTILHIIPILGLEDGIVVPKERIRGSKRVLPKYQELIEAITEKREPRTELDVVLVHAECKDRIDKLLEMLKANFNLREVVISLIGGVIGSHVGPGTWGLAFCSKQ